jgi:hypothetical protein
VGEDPCRISDLFKLLDDPIFARTILERILWKTTFTKGYSPNSSFIICPLQFK